MLHTVASLPADFEALARVAIPRSHVMHLVDTSLLTDAIAGGGDEELARRVVARCQALEALGCEAVLVTCSSIGEAAERASEVLSIPVLRVDQKMAEEAAVLATRANAKGKVAVVATLNCTLEPSTRLVTRALGGATGIEVQPVLCVGAAGARAAGDTWLHDKIVRERVGSLANVDVIILAQASMAGALRDLHTSAPVLTSPCGGIRWLAEFVTEEGINP